MRVDVDVLTLTATPIPRTLEMSLSGIRDLSIIETAPADRRPVRTFVGPFDERLLTAAIRRELARGGQVFVVHNRVQSIGRELRRLRAPRSGGAHRRRPRPDGRAPARADDARLLGRQARRPAVHDDHRSRPRHPDRQHADRRPCRPPRSRAALPAARSCRTRRRAGVRVPVLPVQRPAHADGARTAEDARAVHRARLGDGDRDARPRDPRRRQHAGGRAARPHRGRRFRDVRAAPRGGGARSCAARRSKRRSTSGSTSRSTRTSRRPTSTASRCGSLRTAGSPSRSPRPTSTTSADELRDRFGPLPAPARALLAVARLRADAADLRHPRRLDRAARAARTRREAPPRASRRGRAGPAPTGRIHVR